MRRKGLLRLRVPAAVIAILASLLFATAPSAFAVYPGVNGRIAFTANLTGRSWQLYTMAADGTDLQKVTHIRGSQDVSLAPDWSPDGSQIVFHSRLSGKFRLYVMNADGTNMHMVFDEVAHQDVFPRWSPDGTTILFSRFLRHGGNAGLWIVGADGTGLTKLTGARVDHVGAQYTPDGSTIVYDQSGGGELAAIWRIDADGSNPQQLTPTALRAGLPDVAPDGTRVVFYDGQNGPLPNSIWTMNLDGSDLTRLTDAGCCFHDVGPGYSPDGSKILFTTDRNYVRQCCDELWVMNTDGSDIHELTSNLTVGGCPDGELGNCSYGDWGPAPV